MTKKMKDILWVVFAVVLVAVCAVWFLIDGMEPIEDTNGADDIRLTTITDENILKMDMGALNPISVKRNEVSVAGIDVFPDVRISSNNFSGVYEIFHVNYIGKSDFQLNLTSFTVDKGNFKMVVIHNDEIVATIEPGIQTEYCLEDISGTVSLRIAGESASYCFYMSAIDYDYFIGN